MSIQITVDTVSKYYRSNPAIYNLSFDIKSGLIYGLLGPNGAGKSTLCSILATVLTPDSGKISYPSHSFSRSDEGEITQIRKLIGFLPQDSSLPSYLTVSEYLLLCGEAKGLRSNELYEAFNRTVSRTDLEDCCHLLISSLSKGTAQRVALASAIISDPLFLILDEPTNALDPEQNLIFRKIISERKKDNKITLISSHNLYEIQNLCDKVIIMSKGKILSVEDVNSNSNNSSIVIKATLSYIPEGLTAKLKSVRGVISCTSFGNNLTIEGEKDLNHSMVSRTITNSGADIFSFGSSQPSLEDRYLKIISK